MINREDMLELTRRMTPARSHIDRIAGAYYDAEGYIDGTFNTHFLKLSTAEKTKNLELAKAVLQAETNICTQFGFHFCQHKNRIRNTHNRCTKARATLSTYKVRILTANIPLIQANTSICLSTGLKSKNYFISFAIQSGDHCTDISTLVGIVITAIIKSRYHSYCRKDLIRSRAIRN